MILLDVRDIRKFYGAQPVLDGISFQLRGGQRVGLVGTNGAGKTTLFEILTSGVEPDAGQVTLHRSATFGYLKQHPTIEPGRTLRQEAHSALARLSQRVDEAEQLASAISQASDENERRRLANRYDQLHQQLQRDDGYHIDYRVDRVLHGLGFESEGFDQPVDQLSGGQVNRLMLGKLLLSEPDVMLLDEPSNHLDLESTAWLEKHLAAYKGALIVVSHDRYFLDKVTNRTFELFDGTIETYTGNFSAYWRQKAERVKIEQREFDNQQREIAKLEDFVRRNHVGQKHAQAEDRKRRLEKIERVARPRKITAPAMRFPEAQRSGDIVLRATKLCKSYDKELFGDLTFEIARGERWAILGPNGSGKTTLLKCLLELESPDAGNVARGHRVTVGYCDQQLTVLPQEAELLEAIRRSDHATTIAQRRDLLARFGLTGDMVFQAVSSLSGGERSRAALARIALENANLLVLDEPTNHLDLWARDALEQAIARFDGTVLLVSHDRYFINRVADYLIVFEPEGVRTVQGNYDTYVERTLDKTTAGQQTGGARSGGQETDGSPHRSTFKAAPKKENTGKPRRKRKFAYRKVDDLETEIHRRETRVQELHEELIQPEVQRDGDRVRQTQADLAAEQTALAQLYEHWEEASELN